MEYNKETIDKLSLADLISLHGYCEYWITFYENHSNDSAGQKKVTQYWGPISCICMTEIGFRIADNFIIPTKIWQSSTMQQPDVWTDRSDEEYELMNHLARFNWRKIEK